MSLFHYTNDHNKMNNTRPNIDDLPPFNPPFWLANAHLQTILPRLVRQSAPKYQRQMHLDSTGKTAVAYDFVWANEHAKADKNRPLAVMFHGLEGSSRSAYAVAFANWAKNHDWDAVIVHYRGCGGVENKSHLDYNAGDIGEMDFVLAGLQRLGKPLYAVGVSLGGNMLAKYLGDYGDKARVQAGVVVSAPVDLYSSSKALHKFVAKRIYTPYLLGSLIKKAVGRFDDTSIQKKFINLKTLDGFDELYTAPRHGFLSAKDYYDKSSALPVLKNIVKPTLIISAKDDPFLGIVASENDISPSTQLLYPKHGGHTGFINIRGKKADLTWLPSVVFGFFEKNLPHN